MKDTVEFFPLSEDDEVDDRPIDTTDGWPEHEEDVHDPIEDNPPEAVVTYLNEELLDVDDE